MKTYNFKSEQWLPRPLEEVFGFFADASHLEILTPPWLHFKILIPGPIQMKPGTLIDYRITLHDVPIHWQSEILVWEPPHGFVDVQRRGPYRRWIHKHMFFDHQGGTRVGDEVEYAVPGGAMIQKLFVAPDLHRIFDYKRQRLREIFGKAGSHYSARSGHSHRYNFQYSTGSFILDESIALIQNKSLLTVYFPSKWGSKKGIDIRIERSFQLDFKKFPQTKSIDVLTNFPRGSHD